MDSQTKEYDSRVVRMTQSAARSLASRTSRRSFIGRIGRTAVLAATTGAFLGTVGVEEGLAHHWGGCGSCQNPPIGGGCCGQNTIGCANLTGSNSCPGNTCNCGCWTITVSSSTCASRRREWCDCCGGCADGSNCNCITVGGVPHPTCCRHKEWNDGCQGCAKHIKCRRHRCVAA